MLFVKSTILLLRSYNMYKQIKDHSGSVIQTVIQRKSDGVFIPIDPANTDYIAYLEWEAISGNTIESAS